MAQPQRQERVEFHKLFYGILEIEVLSFGDLTDLFLVNPSASSTGESLKKDKQPMKVPNFIGGKFIVSQGCTIIDVLNPATQEVVSQLPLVTYEEFKDAVIAAKRAFPSWKNTPIATRQQIMFRFQELICRDMDKLATSITSVQGQTLKGAWGDVLCGLEVVEHACCNGNIANGGGTTWCFFGICPFNFPAMIPLWFCIAVTRGKPCEKNLAGFPDGVLNVHGTNDTVDYICYDADVKAISFIGSDPSNIGGKKHAIIMPDASIDDTLNALAAAGFGAAGKRCMALSTAVFVGGSSAWEQELVEHAKALKVNAGTDPSADLGPVISKEVKDHICRVVQSGSDSGARLLLDGRNFVVPYLKTGFVGKTVLYMIRYSLIQPISKCMQRSVKLKLPSCPCFATNSSALTNSGFLAQLKGIALVKGQAQIKTVARQWRAKLLIPSRSRFRICVWNGTSRFRYRSGYRSGFVLFIFI
ncbi:methylmalonate-semialdehyde dehydrogenase [Salix suchowensis]|nr:methylmalonate-semialdehyde dehydrogenase [Salix suchowensis]